LIREQTSGLCLFIGRMMNPAQKWENLNLVVFVH
jgi:hypothetical protein